MSGYDTPLPPEQMAAYQSWKAKLPTDLQNTGDYDLQGAFLAQMKSDGRDHMGDQFKKPNHMTFSDGSQYATPQAPGGNWVDLQKPNAFQPGQNQWMFWGSPTTSRYHTMNDMNQYFQQAEPGSSFVYNSNYKLPSQ